MTQPQALATLASTQLPDPKLAELLTKELAGAVPSGSFTLGESRTDIDIATTAEHLFALVSALKQRKKLAFDYLRNIAGVDYEADGMALKYHLYSFEHNHNVQVTVATGAGHPVVPTLTGLFTAANWHEREASEMFGFQFQGHPNPKNLLLEEDLHIHPLLKAHPLQKVELLQGIEEGDPGFKF
jgi:NADH-quinone oxidoreductase subunit C